MRVGNARYSYFERHPEAFLVPLALAFLFVAYLNLARVAAARAPVGGGPWLASMLLGCACGIALTAGIVLRQRGTGQPWWLIPPLVLGVGMIADKPEVWAVPYPPGVVTSPLQNALLAFCATISIGVVGMLGWFYVATIPAQRIARHASRMPNRDLHISRAEQWRASADRPIGRGEWELFAQEHPLLQHYDSSSDRAREEGIEVIMADTGVGRERAIELSGESRQAAEELKAAIERSPRQAQSRMGSRPSPLFAMERPGSVRLLLRWDDSQVTVLRGGADVAGDVALVLPIASALGAFVYDRAGTRLG